MPAEESTQERRGRPLPAILFWFGVALAPLAALLLLVAQDNGPLRIAAVLAILAVVLIGVSITLRGDAQSVRLDLEERLVDEVEELRTDLRKDIETAARATHKAFGEKLQVLQNELWSIRAQHGGQLSGSAGAAPGGRPGTNHGPRPHLAAPVAGHTGAARVTTPPAMFAPVPQGHRGNVYGGGRGAGSAPVTYGTGAPGGSRHEPASPGSGRYGAEPTRFAAHPDSDASPAAGADRSPTVGAVTSPVTGAFLGPGTYAGPGPERVWGPDQGGGWSAEPRDGSRSGRTRDGWFPDDRREPPSHDDPLQGSGGGGNHSWRNEAWDGGEPVRREQINERIGTREAAGTYHPADTYRPADTYHAAGASDPADSYDPAGASDPAPAGHRWYNVQSSDRWSGVPQDAAEAAARESWPGAEQVRAEPPRAEAEWSGRHASQAGRPVSSGVSGGRHEAYPAESDWTDGGASGGVGGGPSPGDGWYRDGRPERDHGRHGHRWEAEPVSATEPVRGRRPREDTAESAAAPAVGNGPGQERYGYPPSGDVPRAGGARPADLYVADSQWR